ncbi:hypothetical protein CCS41_05105 [Candidatus Fukatsuia symbiotica]|uniref:Flagellar hook-length control protein-like C-terminal domain-containing protein n=1 Tax=Candidatus Fukatsuia symbiotica TaxID=1878942 RepID=A0A2U8IAS1_9GAMM|nr:hypothetical protein CCS41_05105 [Candidatus Fukatsuia symbiotica]
MASPDQWADYRIVSGVLNGTQVRVTLTASGWVLQLRCSNSKTKRLLSRFKARWQRALTRLGVPCSLEVVDAVESIP